MPGHGPRGTRRVGPIRRTPLTPRRLVAHALASAALAGEWNAAALVPSMQRVLGSAGGLPRLVRMLLAAFPEAPRGRFEALAGWLSVRLDRLSAVRARDEAVAAEGWEAGRIHPRFPRSGRAPLVRVYPTFEAAMNPGRWPVPPLPTPGHVADWLGFSAVELDWFCDTRRSLHRLPAGDPRVHYDTRWVPRRDGRPRLVEAPRARLRAAQRQILRELLDRVPPHEAAHGFVRGRSLHTHAALHAGRACVLRLDLADFFPSVPRARIFALFTTLGYPAAAARVLADLCTTRSNREVMRAASWPERVPASERWESVRRLAGPHLPQGAPTSPALANLCAFGLDVRLSALAARVGATYSRYADDLTFSGGPDFAAQARRLVALVAGIALDEGFAVRLRKTRVMPAAQRQIVTGLVVNVRPAVPRDELDRLKAILTNCLRHGPSTQNRANLLDFRAHLTGRVAFVAHTNQGRGDKLRRLLDAIDWDR